MSGFKKKTQDVAPTASPTFAALTVVGEAAAASFDQTADEVDGKIFIPPTLITGSGPAYTLTEDSNLYSLNSAASATDSKIVVPIPLPVKTTASKGRKLTSLVLIFNTDAALTAGTPVLIKNSIAAEGSPPVASVLALTPTAFAAGGLTADDHRLVFTVDTPEFEADDVYYTLEITIDPGANTPVLKIYGVEVYYSERLV